MSATNSRRSPIERNRPLGKVMQISTNGTNSNARAVEPIATMSGWVLASKLSSQAIRP